MGYDAHVQLFVGTEISNVVQEKIESKIIDIKDVWSGNVLKTKTVERTFWDFLGETYNDIYEIESIFNKKGLSFFSIDSDNGPEYVGIGKIQERNRKSIVKTLDQITSDVETVKRLLNEIGYNGEIKIYSTLYESY